MKLTKPAQIWQLRPTAEDLQDGARYAEVTLPWTFDRMMQGTTSNSLQRRALNIAKGIVAQKVLLTELTRRGIDAPEQQKSYRSDDLFDFTIKKNGRLEKLDGKSINYYSNYPGVEREPFTRELVITNADYFGPLWARFFPMLMAHNQIKQDKDAYCFAIATSIDFRKDIDTNRTAYALTAFPYKAYCKFFSERRLTLAREEAGQGIHIEAVYKCGSLLCPDAIELTVIGEWEGERIERTASLRRNLAGPEIGPFSSITAFQVSRDDYDHLHHPNQVEIATCRNDYAEPLRNYRRENINLPPDEVLTLSSHDFCNLILPSDYTLYFLGWITKENFLKKCRAYSSWVWPNDKISKAENQAWTQITLRDRESINRAGFEDCLSGNPMRFNAGWLKGAMRGGACCYVYPNVYGGGLIETNLYVLPQDLNIMATLGA